MNEFIPYTSEWEWGMKPIDGKTYAKDGNATKTRIIFLWTS